MKESLGELVSQETRIWVRLMSILQLPIPVFSWGTFHGKLGTGDVFIYSNEVYQVQSPITIPKKYKKYPFDMIGYFERYDDCGFYEAKEQIQDYGTMSVVWFPVKKI